MIDTFSSHAAIIFAAATPCFHFLLPLLRHHIRRYLPLFRVAIFAFSLLRRFRRHLFSIAAADAAARCFAAAAIIFRRQICRLAYSPILFLHTPLFSFALFSSRLFTCFSPCYAVFLCCCMVDYAPVADAMPPYASLPLMLLFSR